MSDPTKLVFVGAGGHASVLYDIVTAQNYIVQAICTKPSGLISNVFNKISIVRDRVDPIEFDPENYKLVNCIGHMPFSTARFDAWDKYKNLGYVFETIISPRSTVSDFACLDEGVQVMTNATINSNAKIGANTIINTGAIIEHDAKVGASCHIAPGAILCGSVSIADGSFIGAGAIIIQGVNLQQDTIVAAGSIVTKDS
jgi:sugar O-acyltransferase (sialic acid O-acetyltransferase NeuD family)